MTSYAVYFGIAAGLLQIAAAVPYLLGILRGETKPNIVSQFLWTLLQLIAIAAQLQLGWSWSVLILCATTFNTALFTLLCLKGYGYREYGWIDKFCFLAAILSLGLWGMMDNPLAALVVILITYVLSALPTIIKTLRYPATENATAWLMMSCASILSIASVTERTFANLAFPIDFFLESTLIGLIAFFGQRGYRIAFKK